VIICGAPVSGAASRCSHPENRHVGPTKLQLALLTSGAEHPNGSLLSAPEALNVAPNRARKAAGQLIELGPAEERRVADQSASWRADGVEAGYSTCSRTHHQDRPAA
jgi:hypothetical protein